MMRVIGLTCYIVDQQQQQKFVSLSTTYQKKVNRWRKPTQMDKELSDPQNPYCKPHWYTYTCSTLLPKSVFYIANAYKISISETFGIN